MNEMQQLSWEEEKLLVFSDSGKDALEAESLLDFAEKYFGENPTDDELKNALSNIKNLFGIEFSNFEALWHWLASRQSMVESGALKLRFFDKNGKPKKEAHP